MAGLSDFVEPPTEELHLMQIEYEESFGDVIVHLWCRTQDGQRRHVEVEGHNPSFLIREEDYNNRIKNHDWVENTTRGYTTIHDEPLIKVETRLPKHVGGGRDIDKGLREYFDETWEADVFFTSRFLIDTGIHTHFEVEMEETWVSQHIDGDYRVNVSDISPIEDPQWQASPRTITTDIEVLSPDGFPQAAEADQPVTAITAYDNYDEEYVLWVLRYGGWAFSDTEISNLSVENRPETIEIDGEKFPANISDVHVYDEETELLYDFNEYVTEREPDLLSGWNSSATMKGDAFDYPYLLNRCKGLNVSNYRDWSPMGQVWVTRRGREQNLTMGGKGVGFFDMMEAYKKTQWQEPKGGWGLSNTTERELGAEEGKLEIEDIDSAWKSDPTTFLEYNVRDVQAVVGIDVAAGVTELFQNVRALAGVQFENCHNNIDLIDVLVLRYANEMGIALPTNEEPERAWYYGAHVFEPKLGRHENVVYPDLSSMYPNMIRNVNMSPETLIGTKEELDASDYTEDDCRWTYLDTRRTAVKKESDPRYEKVYFLKPSVQEGFLTGVVDDLMGMKGSYDGTPLYDAVKRIVNSCFTPDTEVLTPDGIRNITEIEVGDDVYSWNPKTDQMEEKEVVETIEKPDYEGELVHIQNQNIDIKVTPDHRLYTKRPRHDSGWEITEAGELNEWTHYETPNRWQYEHADGIDTIDIAGHVDKGFELTETKITAGKLHNTFDRRIDGDVFIDFIGWYITEGSAYIASPDERRGDSLHIAQYQSVNPDEYEEICSMCDSLGCHYTQNDKSIEIHGSVYTEFLTNLCGEGSGEKHIPEVVFERASGEQKQRLLDVLMMGDGDSREVPKRYTTKSDKLRDDVIRLLWELGHKPSYTWEGGKCREGSGVWRIHYTRDDRGNRAKQSLRMHRDGSTEVAENGVYCIQVEDNHTLVAGRNGKFVNIPNCYGVFGDSDSYGRGYRLFDWRIAEGITLGGRKMIQDSSEQFVDALNDIKTERGLGGNKAYRVGGDTDSVMTSIPFVDVDYDSEEETDELPTHYDDFSDIVGLADEAVEKVNNWYGEWAEDTLNITEDGHYCELEIESYAPRAFIPEGVTKKKAKKRYAEIIAWDEGEWENPPKFSVTGIDIVRSDRAPVTREVLEDVLNTILREDDRSAARKEVYDRINEEVEAIERGDRSKEWIARPRGMSKHPSQYGSPTDLPMPTYKGAKYANQFFEHERLTAGDKPALLYIDKVRGNLPRVYPSDWETKEAGNKVTAIAANEPNKIPDDFVIDIDKQIEKVLEDPLTPILSPMGWDFDEALSDTEQENLLEFI